MENDTKPIDPVHPREFTIRVGEEVLYPEELEKLEELLQSFDFFRNANLKGGGSGIAAVCHRDGNCRPIVTSPNCATQFGSCRVEQPDTRPRPRPRPSDDPLHQTKTP